MRVQDCSFPVHILMRYRVPLLTEFRCFPRPTPGCVSPLPGCSEILITHNLTEKMVERTELNAELK